MIDAYTMQPHFLWHLAPVFLALPEEHRGHIYVDAGIHECADIAARLNLDLRSGRVPYRGLPEPVILAGGSETQMVVQGRPVILIEHGAGQSYLGMDSAAYSGGFGRDAVVLFLCPNETVAARNRNRYPDARAVAVGAPHLDLDLYYRSTVPCETSRVTVAATFHHDFAGIPETRNAFAYYADAILRLRDQYDLLGHAHPREQWKILPWYAEHGIDHTAHFVDVLERASVLLVDNSSAGLEMAAMGRPIIWLNAPYYRRDVHHGGRFWDWTEMAVTIDGPAQLRDAVELALLDPPDIAAARERWIARTYVAYGEEAARRAVAEILPLVV